MKAKKFRRLVPVLEYLERNWVVLLHIPDARWRTLDVFDAITVNSFDPHRRRSA